MKADLYEPYRYLQDSGVDVSKERIGLRFNAAGASESSKHVVAKALVSYVASRDYGYMTDSEVETVNGDEIDVLLWGVSDRLTYAVELETSPTEEVKKSKLNKYVHQIDAIDDMILINLNELPLELPYQVQFIREQLP